MKIYEIINSEWNYLINEGQTIQIVARGANLYGVKYAVAKDKKNPDYYRVWKYVDDGSKIRKDWRCLNSPINKSGLFTKHDAMRIFNEKLKFASY